jgi:hypothetical protein
MTLPLSGIPSSGCIKAAVDQIDQVVEVRIAADRCEQAQPAAAERFTLKQADHGSEAEHRYGLRSAVGGAGSNLEERGARLQRGILTIDFRLR